MGCWLSIPTCIILFLRGGDDIWIVQRSRMIPARTKRKRERILASRGVDGCASYCKEHRLSAVNCKKMREKEPGQVACSLTWEWMNIQYKHGLPPFQLFFTRHIPVSPGTGQADLNRVPVHYIIPLCLSYCTVPRSLGLIKCPTLFFPQYPDLVQISLHRIKFAIPRLHTPLQ